MKAVAKGKNLQISLKDSILISRKIKGMKLDKARKFLEDLVNKKVSIEGKYYTKTANTCLLYTSPSPRDRQKSRMPSSA